VSSCFQTDGRKLNSQTVAQPKEGGRQIRPVLQAKPDLASVPDDLTRHMDHQVQKGAKLHRQQSCAFGFVLRSMARANRQQQTGPRFQRHASDLISMYAPWLSRLSVGAQASRQTLTSLVESLANRPDMQEAVRILMRPDNMLETFSELAVKDPDLMRVVLQACVAALVNVQSVETVEAEMKRRAVKGN
jgi:hypothetical protein